MKKPNPFFLIIALSAGLIVLPTLSFSSQIYAEIGAGVGKIKINKNKKYSFVGSGDIGYPLSKNFSAEIGFNYFRSPKTINIKHNFNSNIVLKGHYHLIKNLEIFGKIGPAYNIVNIDNKYHRALSALFAAGIESHINHVSVSTQFTWITRSMSAKEIPAYLAGIVLIGYRF